MRGYAMKKWWKKKWYFALAVVVLLGVFGISAEMHRKVQTGGKKNTVTIVVDAGHGGIDPGKVGINGSYEKDINLAIARYLKEILEKKKCRVIMTRETDTGLYQQTDTNKKVSDLQRRVEIMNAPEVDVVVSVHQNSYTGESSKGAQVFYQRTSERGEQMAKAIQAQLISSLGTWNHRQAKENNSYYLLKKTTKPAVIVECGFLSNSEEAEKLCDESYQRQVAWAIAQGALTYMENAGSSSLEESEDENGATESGS